MVARRWRKKEEAREENRSIQTRKKTPVSDTRGNQGWETAGRLEREPPEAVSVPDPRPPQELHPYNRRVSAITQKASTPSPSPCIPLLLPLRIRLPLFSLVLAGFHARRGDQKKSVLCCTAAFFPVLLCFGAWNFCHQKTYSLIYFVLPCSSL
jgi:hypothetical protein